MGTCACCSRPCSLPDSFEIEVTVRCRSTTSQNYYLEKGSHQLVGGLGRMCQDCTKLYARIISREYLVRVLRGTFGADTVCQREIEALADGALRVWGATNDRPAGN